MLLRFILACLAGFQWSFAKIPNATVMIEGKDYDVSLSELQCRPASREVAHGIKITKQPSMAAILGYAGALADSTGGRYDLVLYPKKGIKNEATRRVLTRKILVQLVPKTDPAMILKSADGHDFSIPSYAPSYLIITCAETGDSLKYLDAVRRTLGVISAKPLLAKKRFKRFTPNDPRYSWSPSNTRYQWHLKNTGQNNALLGADANLEPAWDMVTGAGITIGIIDDGLDNAHPDLAANINTEIDRDWNDGTPDDPTPNSSFDDHGTSCAGVCAAKGNNNIGVSGAAPDATLVGLRLIAGYVGDSEEAEAINWQNNIIEIKNNSWGPADGGGTLEAPGPLLKNAYKDSAENGRNGLGTLHLWAAGNGGSNDNVNQDGYASSIYTIAIGALSDTDERSYYSEPGCSKVVSTHSNGGGQGITTTTLVQNGNYTDSFGGTSSATPLASGVVALMLQRNPSLGWRDVQEILIASARKNLPSDPGWFDNGAGQHFNHDFGAGAIDAKAAVDLAASWENLDEQQSFSLTRDLSSQGIPDHDERGMEIDFDLTAFENLRVEQVTLSVNITHPNRGQLTIALVSPAGTESLLAVPHQNAGPDYDDWKMMTVFNWGEESSGVWKLKVIDSDSGQIGTLDAATIEIFGSSATSNTAPPEFIHGATANGNVASDFFFSVRAGNAATFYTATGLPDGLLLNEANGIITGVPTEEGNFSVALSATNDFGTANSSLNIIIDSRIPTPPVITSDSSASAVLGQVYTYQIEATNFPTTYRTSMLPAGFTLSQTGLIFGTPVATGEFPIIITATNADGADSVNFTLAVIEATLDPLAQALDNADLVFVLDGAAAWELQSAVSFFDDDALESPNLSHNESAGFSVVVTGPGLLTFQWKVSSEEKYDELTISLDGEISSAISGEQDWQQGFLIIPEGRHTVTWTYQKDGSVSNGDDLGWIDQVDFTLGNFSTTVGDALDYPGLSWIPDGEWLGQKLISSDGQDALQSPSIDDSEETSLEVELTGPGQLEFYYRCESEENYDYFTFTRNGVEEFSVSGTVGWTRHTATIPSGTHILRWSYQKDFSNSIGADAVWLDQIIWQTSTLTSAQHWANRYFSPGEQTDSAVGQPESDPDRDGRANLMEYALETSPLEAGLNREPIVANQADFLTLTYQRDLSKSDIFYRVEESSDLFNWTPVPDNVIATNGNIETRRAVRLRLASRHYLRLRVGFNP